MWSRLLCVLSAALIPFHQTAGAEPLERRVASMTILFTGDADGEYLPCGCPGSPMGGYARRATLIRQVRQEGRPVIVLDTGNALLRGGQVRIDPDDAVRRHATFVGRLLALSGTQAVAVGARDLWALGPERLKRLARETGVAWLSANLVSKAGKPVFPAHMTMKAGSLRVGVVGVTQPLPAVLRGNDLEFQDPVRAARAAVTALRADVDVMVVVCNLTYEQQVSLRQIPGIDLILAGTPETGVPIVTGDHPPCVIRVHGLGRTVGRVDLRIVRDSPQAPRRSRTLEKQFESLSGIQGELETLKQLIIEEEGTFDRRRWIEEGAYLRSKRDALLDAIRAADATRSVFAYREIVLYDRMKPDPRVQRHIDAHERRSRQEGPKP